MLLLLSDEKEQGGGGVGGGEERERGNVWAMRGLLQSVASLLPGETEMTVLAWVKGVCPGGV